MTEKLQKNPQKTETDEIIAIRLTEEYGDMLLRTCFLYLKDYQLAEDAVQEILIKAVRTYGSLRNREAEKAWLLKIAVNFCKSMLRGRWLKSYRYGLTGEDGEAVFAAARIPDLDEKSALSNALAAMKTADKEVLLLYYYWGFDLKEIAEMTGKKENAAAQRLSRARKKLRKILLEAGYEE